jgi:hypothetical protein
MKYIMTLLATLFALVAITLAAPALINSVEALEPRNTTITAKLQRRLLLSPAIYDTHLSYLTSEEEMLTDSPRSHVVQHWRWCLRPLERRR